MFLPHRFLKLALGAVILITIPGCFLFGGKEKSTESAIGATQELREGQVAADEALSRAESAIEEERYDAAIIEYNRAIRADSTNADTYIKLARLYGKLSAQYRNEGNIEAALQENVRALKTLSDLVDYQSKSAASLGPSNSSATPVETGTAPAGDQTAPRDEKPPEETPAPKESNPDAPTP